MPLTNWWCYRLNCDWLLSGADNQIILWDLSNGESVTQLRSHSDAICSLNFSREGAILASGLTRNLQSTFRFTLFDFSVSLLINRIVLIIISTRGVHPSPKASDAYSPYSSKIYKVPHLFFVASPCFDCDVFTHHAWHVLDTPAPYLRLLLLVIQQAFCTIMKSHIFTISYLSHPFL